MSTLKELAFSKEELLKCTGYNSKFIDGLTNISHTSIIPKARRQFLPKVEGNKNGVLNYTNLSVLYHSERQIPFFSAYNINGAEKKTKISRSNSFHVDSRINSKIQLSSKFYQYKYEDKKSKKLRKIFEIGHVAAHNEMSWGEDAQTQAYRTFHFPNSFPQAEILNCGLWRSLENYIINETSTVDDNRKISVFTGPFILNSDPFYINCKSFQIPILFFKVVVFSTEKGLFSTAFVMSHEKKIKELGIIDQVEDLFGKTAVSPDFIDFKYKKVFQISMNLLEKESGLNFTWKGVKKVKIKDQINQLQIIKNNGEIAEVETLRGSSKVQSKEKINIILP